MATTVYETEICRAAVMLTCAVCSLLRASCLFSRSHPPFSFPLVLYLPAFHFPFLLRAPFGQHQESRLQAKSNDIPVLNGFVSTID